MHECDYSQGAFEAHVMLTRSRWHSDRDVTPNATPISACIWVAILWLNGRDTGRQKCECKNVHMLCMHQASAWTVALRMTRGCLAWCSFVVRCCSAVCASYLPQRSVLSVKWIAINYGRFVIFASRSIKLSFARPGIDKQNFLELHVERRTKRGVHSIGQMEFDVHFVSNFYYISHQNKKPKTSNDACKSAHFFRQHQPVARRMLW